MPHITMNGKPRIAAHCDIPFLKGVLEPFARMTYVEGSRIAHDDLADADALIIRTRTRCDAKLLEGTPVRLIATATIGYDHIDADYCAGRGIEVVTAQGCNARGVLQYVSAALYELSRRDAWSPHRMTLGVVGAGNVGSLVAEYGKRFGFRVLCCDPPKAALDPQGGYLPLDERAVPVGHRHLPCAADRGGALSHFAHGFPGILRGHEAGRRIHQFVPRKSGLRRGADRGVARRPCLPCGDRYVERRTEDRPPAALARHAGHSAHCRLFDSGQGCGHGCRRAGRRPSLRLAAGRLVSARSVADPSRSLRRVGGHGEAPCPAISISSPNRNGSKAGPRTSSRSATGTTTGRSFSDRAVCVCRPPGLSRVPAGSYRDAEDAGGAGNRLQSGCMSGLTGRSPVSGAGPSSCLRFRVSGLRTVFDFS